MILTKNHSIDLLQQLWLLGEKIQALAQKQQPQNPNFAHEVNTHHGQCLVVVLLNHQKILRPGPEDPENKYKFTLVNKFAVYYCNCHEHF